VEGKFAAPDKSKINYAYHLDASLYARYLRRLSETRGTRRVEGKIQSVDQNPETGFIEALVSPANGSKVICSSIAPASADY
jgi:tryptophan halogenase